MTADEGVWLYSITTDSIGDAQLAGVTGVAGEPVRAVASAGLAAVVGTVSLSEFGQEPLQRNLEDLDWLAATARAHDSVVAAVLRCGPTVPLRLATLYLDDDRVRLLLDERQEEFSTALRRVTGRSEWGVKAFGDAKVLAQNVKEEPSATGAKGKGTAYLLRRRAELSAQQDVERRAAGHAGEIHSALLGRAVDGLRRQVTDPVLTGKRAWMIFNGTYLVDNARIDDFAALVSALDAERPGITLDLTGPWPPYSFAGIDG
ncbi:gas vesicle synthesis protein [Rhodococcus opacus PD630]|uniref:GvpL/GvpF family gas vesicle protein n=1 Tax=Rhodococcus TaxID=1827 RepID=UPI00029CD25A|nr:MULTISPECIES: GvpL/GvpF family gas vesicle protein [Rhodococcus]AHK31434.1 Protein gvpL 1 [Rhodococcus opacus PD630]EHI43110.1 gas vesicle synthesis protein [Rhodococcus opacus PD630]KXX59809.1 gas vesicle protein GvpFL [Rhodococcus sp. LB1]PBC45379.1 gas vesicle protein GvpFL [Rhodococcus sp. ACPA1]UDG94016.1 GvpL/GvpF family gas vesicle protein [Rhodococcus opacus PD630]